LGERENRSVSSHDRLLQSRGQIRLVGSGIMHLVHDFLGQVFHACAASHLAPMVAAHPIGYGEEQTGLFDG
jgi:hypothetical protein